MRVVQLLTQSRGGPVDHAAYVACELHRLGADSHVVGPPGEYVDVLEQAGVRWHPAAVTHAGDLQGAWATSRLVDRLRPDVVHAQDRRAGLLARIRPAPRAASVYTLHGVPDGLAGLVPGNLDPGRPTRRDRLAYLTAERRLARRHRSTVVTPCEALAHYARDHVGVAPDRVTVVPNGVPLPSEPGARAPRTGPVVAVWLGLMQPVKRVPALVRAAADVPDLRLRLVGDGPERPVVEAAIARAGSAARVELVGHAADPGAHLAGADLFVLPSAAEACPLALLQAMARGLPVVASRAGGIPEIVRDGIDGLLVPTGDDRGLVEALRALVADPALRARMGRSAREQVAGCFTVERCARRLLDVYREVAA
jgi:glycosyltransferase involved in cell wall biosynthesis